MLDPTVRAGFRRRAITAAMAELCVEQGYLGTSVADVAARARMSRATVYGLFANREQIFLTLLDHGVAEVLGLAEGSCRRAGLDPRARIEAALGAILGWVAEHPKEAHAFLVEAQAATPEALGHYHAAIADLATLLGAAVPVAEVGSVRFEEIIVGGLASVLAGLARQSRLEEVPALLEDFVGLVTAPYFPTGAEADLTG
jgi:AcrR family transcriptional regulator